jgi:hypothetical protein
VVLRNPPRHPHRRAGRSNGLQHIDPDRREKWAARLDAAENSRPSDFKNNGWVVEALQGAWSAILTTPVPEDDPTSGVSASTTCA